jgi:hypothetical protein
MRDEEWPHLTPRKAATPPPPRPTPEDLREYRQFGENNGLMRLCAYEQCRRGRQRCRGPKKIPEFFSDTPLPACVADLCDALYAPVYHYDVFKKRLAAALARFQAQGLLDEAGRPVRRLSHGFPGEYARPAAGAGTQGRRHMGAMRR